MFGLNAFKIKQAHANTSLRPSYIFLTMFSFVPVTKKAASFCACCGFIALLCGTVTSAVVVFEAVSDETITAKRILSCYGRPALKRFLF